MLLSDALIPVIKDKYSEPLLLAAKIQVEAGVLKLTHWYIIVIHIVIFSYILSYINYNPKLRGPNAYQ